MSIDDAQNIIAYGSLEKGLVETHNGKKVFSSKYQQIANGENKSENIIKANDENIQKSLEYTAQKRVLNDEFVMLEIYFCGDIKSQMIFKVDDFNKYFKGMHVFKLKRTKQHNEIMFSCKSTSQGISIMLNVLAIGVNHLDDSLRDENIKVIWKIDKVKRLKELALLEEQEKAKTIEDQISRLSSEISTAMADAFASAKKRK
ncbi:hypothetical protein GQR86_05995 [Providencia vermicola]|nr:hypothetical protein [Providencia sp. G1(2023)]MBC8652930.1 hypothetical protein [Providencia vermicola]